MRRVKKVLTVTILILIVISLWYNKTYATFTQKFNIPIESASSLDGIRKNIVNEISKNGYTGDSNFVVGETGNNRTWTGSNGTEYSAVIVITRSKEQKEGKKYTATISVSEKSPSISTPATYKLYPNSSTTSDGIRSNIIASLTANGYTSSGRDEFTAGTTNTRTWTNSDGSTLTATINIEVENVTTNEDVYNATVSVTAEVLTADEAGEYNSSNSSDSDDSSSVGGSGGHWVSSGSSSSDGSGIVSPIENPSYYEPSANTEEDNSLFSTMGGKIIGIIRAIGTAISVITLMTLGIRYMMASTQDKALYKETMIPYLIGAIMLFTIPNFIGILYDLVKNITF